MDNFGISPLAKAIGIAANITSLRKAYDDRFQNKVGYRPYKTPVKACDKLQFMQLPTSDIELKFATYDSVISDICRAFNVPIELLITADNSRAYNSVYGVSPLAKYLNKNTDENS